MQEPLETWAWSLGWEDPLEEEMATHYSILVRIIPWTEEPGGLQSVGVTKSQTWPNMHTGIAKPLFTVAAVSSFIVPSAVDMNLFPSIFAVTFFWFLLSTWNYFAILTTSEMKHLFMILPLNCFFYVVCLHSFILCLFLVACLFLSS